MPKKITTPIEPVAPVTEIAPTAPVASVQPPTSEVKPMTSAQAVKTVFPDVPGSQLINWKKNHPDDFMAFARECAAHLGTTLVAKIAA